MTGSHLTMRRSEAQTDCGVGWEIDAGAPGGYVAIALSDGQMLRLPISAAELLSADLRDILRTARDATRHPRVQPR